MRPGESTTVGYRESTTLGYPTGPGRHRSPARRGRGTGPARRGRPRARPRQWLGLTGALLVTRRLTAAGVLVYGLAVLIYLSAFGSSLDGFIQRGRAGLPAGTELAAPAGSEAAITASRSVPRVMIPPAPVPDAVAAPTRAAATGSNRPARSSGDASGSDLVDPEVGEPAVEAAEVAELPEAAVQLVRDASVSVTSGLQAAVPAAVAANTPMVGGRKQPRSVVPPNSGDGSYLVVPGRDAASVAPRGQVIRYTVEVERGLPFDAEEFAADVHRILNDPRGWGGDGQLGFERVDHGPVRLSVSLSSPNLTDAQCAPLRTFGRVSCWNGNRAVINALRWGTGAATYGDDILSYREYLIGHEVGHGLGHRHVHCTDPGRLAPIMVQQTKSLEGCRANPWPNPHADRD